MAKRLEIIEEKFKGSYVSPETYDLLYEDILDWLIEGDLSAEEYGERFGEVLSDILQNIRRESRLDTETFRAFRFGVKQNF